MDSSSTGIFDQQSQSDTSSHAIPKISKSNKHKQSVDSKKRTTDLIMSDVPNTTHQSSPTKDDKEIIDLVSDFKAMSKPSKSTTIVPAADRDITIVQKSEYWCRVADDGELIVPFSVVLKGEVKSIRNKANSTQNDSDAFDQSKRTWVSNPEMVYSIGQTDIIVIDDARIDLMGRTGSYADKYGSDYVSVGIPEDLYSAIMGQIIKATGYHDLRWKGSDMNETMIVYSNVNLPPDNKPQITMSDTKIPIRKFIVARPGIYKGRFICSPKLTAYVDKTRDLRREESNDWTLKLNILGFHVTGKAVGESGMRSGGGQKRF